MIDLGGEPQAIEDDIVWKDSSSMFSFYRSFYGRMLPNYAYLKKKKFTNR